MRIAVIYGNMPHYDNGLGKVMQVFNNALKELGMEIDEISLGFAQLPCFDGMRAHGADDIVSRMRASTGVVFASTAQLFAPTAMLQTFLEYLESEAYANALQGKHCFLATVSKTGGERSALEYLARVVQHFGGARNHGIHGHGGGV